MIVVFFINKKYNFALIIQPIKKMETTDIIRDISRLPILQRMLVVEYIVRSMRLEEQLPLEKSATRLYSDYLNDKDLTQLTQLDYEHFYEAR